MLKAQSAGVVASAPDMNDVGRWFEVEQEQQSPFCTINEPNQMRVCLPLTAPELNRLIENVAPQTKAALTTLHNLRKTKGKDKTVVTVDYQDVPLGKVLEDLHAKAPAVEFNIDPDSGLTSTLPISYQAREQPLADALDMMFLRAGLGYTIVSDTSSEQDGHILVRPGHERPNSEGPRTLVPVPITVRIQGRGLETWQGKVAYLPQSEAKEIPLQLSNRGGGPVAVKTERTKTGGLIPQTQYYLVYVDIVNPDPAMAPGTMAQVKIQCKSETCLKWLWRTINTSMELKLM